MGFILLLLLFFLVPNYLCSFRSLLARPQVYFSSQNIAPMGYVSMKNSDANEIFFSVNETAIRRNAKINPRDQFSAIYVPILPRVYFE